MEKTVEKRLDSILEDEVQRGFRIKELPVELQRQLSYNDLPVIERVRFSRLNPARRRKVNEAVQKQYHRDLQNKDLLSNDQIMKLVQERGEWSPANDERIKELQSGTNRAMGELYLEGLTEGDWYEKLLAEAQVVREEVEKSELSADDKRLVLEAFERWTEFTPERRAIFTEKYAKLQGLEEYSAARDLQYVMEHAPTADMMDSVNEIDDLKDKLSRFIQLGKERSELVELQLKHAKIFSESVESRRDNAEELARLYFTCEQVDENDKPQGPLAVTFEAMWDFPDEVIQWFLVENYFFSNGIPDAAREYLETFGFIKAARAESSTSGASEPSGELLDPQSSKDDSQRSGEISAASMA